jgi:hypothetical protein
MAFQVINSIYSIAYRGKAAKITATSNVYFPQLFIGQVAQVSSSQKQGFVCGPIDIYNYTFMVRPMTPNARFDSQSSLGILSTQEIITLFP